jgi:hypothetical protein
MCFVQKLLPSILHFYQLMYSLDHVIKLFLAVLEELFHQKGELRRKNFFSSIYKLERGDA